MNGRAQKYRFVPLIALGLIVLVVGGGAVLLIRHFLAGAPPAQKKVAQEIHIIRPPPEELPPPPPPPPPEEKVDIPDPQQQPEPDPTPSNDPPPADLGLDADASAGSDGFGLAARKGGRDLLATGGSALSWYAGLLKNAVLDGLQNERSAHTGSYTVMVKVWVRQDGTIERIALAQSSGDKERDRAIEAALQRISRMPQAPPADMPQPVSLQIVSRG